MQKNASKNVAIKKEKCLFVQKIAFSKVSYTKESVPTCFSE